MNNQQVASLPPAQAAERAIGTEGWTVGDLPGSGTQAMQASTTLAGPGARRWEGRHSLAGTELDTKEGTTKTLARVRLVAP